MRFSVRWLRQYLHTDVPLNKIIDALYQCGLEVEGVIDLGMQSGKVVVGQILRIEPVEGAEKIRLCTVKADEPETLQIICGARNIVEGQKVPVARFGMTFPDGTVLKPRKILGIEGQGMLCSAAELGVAEDADGIWILPDDAPVGEPWDALIEISITPNRPDALSIMGVARDLAAKIPFLVKGARATLKGPDLAVEEGDDRTETLARVTVTAKDDCPRYTARVVTDVKIGPSPRWMQVVLESAGLRPINNVVDISNFVLLELGHPLHSFDLDLVAGAQIVVRNAQQGETIATLDGATQKLEPTDLLICDALKPVALAGIMGGGNSEIRPTTTNVLIESAYFRPSTIRKTSKRLDKSTDSSYRFERGTDQRRLTAALNRCARLLVEIAGGTASKGVIDIVSRQPEKDQILVRLPRLNRVLGLQLTGREVADVLTPLGFEIHRSDREEMLVEAPSHRVDVSIEADIIEEVARIVGYDRIEERRLALSSEFKPQSPLDAAREALADAAVSQGFCQAINFSFVSEGANAILGADDKRQVRVLNPITSDQSVMRRGLLPSLLQNVLHNLNQSVDDIALFELGSTYEFESEEAEVREAGELKPPARETPYFAAALCGHLRQNWKEGEVAIDFFATKGIAEHLTAQLGLQKPVLEIAGDVSWLHPGRAARILVKGVPVALFGEVNPLLLKQLGIRKPVYYIEIPLLGAVLDAASPRKFIDIARFPAVSRDIALVVDHSARSLDLERAIRKAGKEMLSGLRLFDVYEGEHVAAGKKSLAYSLTYRAADRTLKEDEVNTRHAEILEALARDAGAVLR